MKYGLPALLAIAGLLAGAPAAVAQGTGTTTTVPPVPHQQVPTTTAPTTTPAPATAPAPTTTPAPTTPTTTPVPGQAAPQPTPAPNAAPGAADQRIERAAGAGDDAGAPPILVALAALGVLLLAGLILWTIAHWWAWEPSWAPRWRHAAAEAGWRASLGWADFRDWLRLGR